MNTYILSCLSCAGPLPTQANGQHKCEYCGNLNIVRDAPAPPRALQPSGEPHYQPRLGSLMLSPRASLALSGGVALALAFNRVISKR